MNKILWNLLRNKSKRKEIIDSLSQSDIDIIGNRLDKITKIASQEKPDFDLILEKIEAKRNITSSRRIFAPLKYVASIVVLVGTSYLFYFIYDNLSNLENSKIVLTKQENNPVDIPKLILDDGSIINLKPELTNEIIKTKLFEIKNSNRTLTYDVKSDSVLVPKYNTIVVPRGAEYSVKLSDGTIVYLNSESKLKYPINFIGKKRQVFLKGEGYFKVTKNKKKPFIVNVEDVNIKVLGTTFNVNSYEENDGITTTLVNGSVEVSTKKFKVLLKPNQQAICNGNDIYKEDVDVNKYVSWISGNFYFDRISLEKLMTQIERWYDVNVFFVDQNIKSITFSGVIQKDLSIAEVMEMVGKISNLKIRIKDKNVFIEKI